MLLYIFIKVSLLILSVVGNEVGVYNGVVRFGGYNSCIVYNDGNIYNVSRDETAGQLILDKPLFGLIKWECDVVYSGIIVSFFRCAECGIYCAYNQYIEKCKSNTLPLALGILCSLLLFIIIILLSVLFLRKPMNKWILDIVMHFVMKKDVERVNRIKLHNADTKQNIKIMFDDVQHPNPTIMKEIIRRRLILSGNDPNNEQIYSEILYNTSADRREIDIILNRSKERYDTLKRQFIENNHNNPTITTKGPTFFTRENQNIRLGYSERQTGYIDSDEETETLEYIHKQQQRYNPNIQQHTGLEASIELRDMAKKQSQYLQKRQPMDIPKTKQKLEIEGTNKQSQGIHMYDKIPNTNSPRQGSNTHDYYSVRSNSKNKTKSTQGTSFPANVVRGVALLSVLGQHNVQSCDQMLYIKSDGRVCYNNNCYDLSTYSLMLGDGETACFRDLENNKLEIKLNKLYHIARYSKLYDTCSYNITNEMTWNCYGSGKCWYGNECGQGYMLNKLEKKSKNPHGYGCHMTTVSCNSMCTHGVSCVWYRWEVEPDLTEIASVYSSVSDLWEATMTISYKGTSNTIVLNTNNPKYDLNDIINLNMKHMPIYIQSIIYESPMLKDSIVEYKKHFYNLDVSQHNLPVRNMIGDIQISKDRQNIIFYTDNIDCSTDSCVVKCLINEPSINRLKYNGPYQVPNENIVRLEIYNEDWINYKSRVAGSVSIAFGNIALKELIVEKPHCKIDVVLSYACTSCLEQPKVILASKDLIREGSLEYESNCTWSYRTLSCNAEMYEMKQVSKNKFCRIYIPMLNQTLDITFEYEYRGRLNDMKSIKAETASDILSSIVSDPSFYNSLLGSLSSVLLITTISAICIKLARLGVLAYSKKEVQQA